MTKITPGYTCKEIKCQVLEVIEWNAVVQIAGGKDQGTSHFGMLPFVKNSLQTEDKNSKQREDVKPFPVPLVF